MIDLIPILTHSWKKHRTAVSVQLKSIGIPLLIPARKWYWKLTWSTKIVFLDSHYSSVHPIIHSFVIIRHGLTYQKLSYRIEIQYHLSRQANICTLCENCSKCRILHQYFWYFWWIFVHSKFKLSSLRSQCRMRLFLWFSNTVDLDASDNSSSYQSQKHDMHFNLAKRAAEHRSFRFVSRIAFLAKITTEYPRPSQYPLSSFWILR